MFTRSHENIIGNHGLHEPFILDIGPNGRDVLLRSLNNSGM